MRSLKLFVLMLVLLQLAAKPAQPAPASLVIFSNPSDGTQLSINYDDQTLLATTLNFVVPNINTGPLYINATNAGVNGGQPICWQAPPNTTKGQYTFAPPLQGVQRFLHGQPYIEWGFTQIQAGSKGAGCNPGATIVHVTPNG